MTQVPPVVTASEPVLKASEVARAWRVDPGTVRRWAASGLIEHQRLPSGQLRFPASVLNAKPPDDAAPAIAASSSAGTP